MAYVIAWSVYLLMAALVMVGFERYLSEHFSRQPRLFIRALLAIVLFTPGVVPAEQMYVVPACIGMLFNLLAKSGQGFLKSSLPMLAVAVVVFGVLFVRDSRREPSDETVAETPQD